MGVRHNAIYMNGASLRKLGMVALASVVGLLAAFSVLLGMARSWFVTYFAIGAAPLLGGWLMVASPPHKRLLHVLGLIAFGLIVWLGGYVVPVGLIYRVMLGYLAWYAVVEVSAWVRGKR